MTDESEHNGLLIKKVLVAMDSSRHSEVALQAAAAIAKTLEANIEGLFVQDTHLMQMSRFPSIAEVSLLTGDVKPIRKDELELQVRRLEARIKHRFEQISQNNRLSYSWKTMQGRVVEKLLEASRDADLVTIGMKGEVYSGRKKLGSTAKAVIENSRSPVLILQKELRIGGSIIAIDNGTEAGVKGIELGLSLAAKTKSKLLILKENEKQDVKTWKDELENLIGTTSVKVEARILDKVAIEALLNIMNREKGRLLIVPKNRHFGETRTIEKLLYNLNNPILLIN